MNSVYCLIPHFIVKEPIPPITNQGLLDAIEQVRKTGSVEEAMQTGLNILSKKYISKHFSTLLLIWLAFEGDPNKLWQRSGFLHCTQQNFLFRILMVKSGKIRDEDITFGHSFVWYISPHQYLKVRLSDRMVAVDTWNYQLGAKIGEYATGFGVKSL